LVGWIISGTLLNAALDVAAVWGLIEGPGPQIAIVAGVGVFIMALHMIGRRDSLRLRFASLKNCAACNYDLTGNLSGRCPECGHVVQADCVSVA
jgi:hypothetical protein